MGGLCEWELEGGMTERHTAPAGAGIRRRRRDASQRRVDAIIGSVKHNRTSSQQETVEALLDASSRTSRSVPMRVTFVQRGAQNNPQPGALAAMLSSHDERALDLYLLFRASASSKPWDTTRDARVWARALGLPTPRDNGAATVSKIWSRLDNKYHLVARSRRGRLAKVTALDENGSGKGYVYPSGGGSNRYFKIPFQYWTGQYYLTLSFTAKAMLMIALSLRSPFILPTTRVREWYGVSADSAERGLQELRDKGLLDRKLTVKPAPLAPLSITQEYRYTIRPPFHRRTSKGRLTVVPSAS
jgi:hypothetical protein